MCLVGNLYPYFKILKNINYNLELLIENNINNVPDENEELFYLICGPYNDVGQHFAIDNRPILKGGLSSIYERAKKALEDAKEGEETDFLNAVCEGMLCLKRAAEKFSEKAKELLETAESDEAKKNYTLVYNTAKRIPWEKPETFL